jgi:hypothetical protein
LRRQCRLCRLLSMACARLDCRKNDLNVTNGVLTTAHRHSYSFRHSSKYIVRRQWPPDPLQLELTDRHRPSKPMVPSVAKPCAIPMPKPISWPPGPYQNRALVVLIFPGPLRTAAPIRHF